LILIEMNSTGYNCVKQRW